MNRKDDLIAKLLTRNGLRAKINAKCCECAYDDVVAGNGSWLQQVADCAGYSCPLYSVRPVPSKKGTGPDDPTMENSIENAIAHAKAPGWYDAE